MISPFKVFEGLLKPRDLGGRKEKYSQMLAKLHEPYVKYVKDKRLIDTYGNNFNPSQGMTREAVAKLIYRTIMLRISGADQYTPNMSVSVDKSNVFFGINS